MGKIRIFIYTKNPGYGERLMRFAASRENPYIRVELLTEIPEETSWEVQDVVVSDDRQWIQQLDCRCVLLTQQRESNEERAIFMYQRCEDVYHQMLEFAGADEERKEGTRNGQKVYCVFSPDGGDGKTLLAWEKAVELGREKEVLYISMCEFPVLFGGELVENPGEPGEGLSDLILSAQSSGGRFEERLEEVSFVYGAIHVLTPVEQYRDLLDYTTEEIRMFVQALRRQERYGAILFEMGQLFEYSLDILSMADEVLVPEEEGFLAAVRRHVFGRYCAMEGRQALLERISYVPVRLAKGCTKDQVEELLEQGMQRRDMESPGDWRR